VMIPLVSVTYRAEVRYSPLFVFVAVELLF